MIELPTKKDLLELVRKLREEFPDDPIEVLSEEKLEQALKSTEYMIMYDLDTEDLRSELIDIAVKLMYEISFLHPLVDGNKRLAALVFLSVLKINGFELPSDTETTIRMVYSALTRAVTSGKDWDEIVEGFRKLLDAMRKFNESLKLFES